MLGAGGVQAEMGQDNHQLRDGRKGIQERESGHAAQPAHDSLIRSGAPASRCSHRAWVPAPHSMAVPGTAPPGSCGGAHLCLGAGGLGGCTAGGTQSAG